MSVRIMVWRSVRTYLSARGKVVCGKAVIFFLLIKLCFNFRRICQNTFVFSYYSRPVNNFRFPFRSLSATLNLHTNYTWRKPKLQNVST